ncbi:hypothetical protein [Herbaspirillum robiniae]|uniref:Uncharacterized protein n=1 Tax=Herbaspirillum robiniae TaxID=2014887 RepID=A0ABX2LTI7_9BURK|nr:hypothetical protein [Herbaspirillum robiniae]NUU00543.1 hypothetical protein [Herbaspirillum robiniae]
MAAATESAAQKGHESGEEDVWKSHKRKRRICDAPSKTPDAFPAVKTAQSNARLLSFLGIDTVCYAPPALYPVNLATAFPMHRKACRKACTSTTQNIIKDCQIRFAEAATVACRFSRARTLTVLAVLFKALF